MAFLLGVVIFVIALLVSVVLHEFGHFLTAKTFRMKVTQFFVGFGTTLWSFRRGETEYGVKALPLGGFVKITGMTHLEEVDTVDEPRSFSRHPGWQRLIVLFAGSFMHFLLAFLLLFAIAVGIGVPNANRNTVFPLKLRTTDGSSAVSACLPRDAKAFDDGSCGGSTARSPASLAGLRAGDTIVSVAGKPVHTWDQLDAAIRAKPAGWPTDIVVVRDSKRLTLRITPAKVPGRSGSYIGIEEQLFQRAGVVGGVSFAGNMFGEVVTTSVQAVAKLPAALPYLFSKNRSKTPGGDVTSVVGAADVAGQVVEAGGGWQYVVTELLLIVLSLNIFVGLFNLLPLLPMDGGHMAVVIYEMIRSWIARLLRRPDPGLVDIRRLIPVSVGLFALIVGLGLILIAADIFNPIHLTQ
jgi:membrane-associated protease RseP (regulator of RpoE activity)